MTTTRKQPSETPEIFGPYEVYERLGVGGMATVHRAKERGIEGFERIVALKRLLPHLAEDASFVRSFVREAKLASMLQHANIVQLYELGRVGHVLFISMEYIEGRDIRKILRRARKVAGPPPISVFLSLMTQLCEALDYAHRRQDGDGQPLGLVHRDVSPSNLLVTLSGHLKVIDFGIAKAQSSHLKTQTGRIKGKLAYMGPEAIRGQELDARSDIFSAGVIAHELLTARPLFATKNEYQTLLRVQRAEIEPPSTFNPDCPPELDQIVLRALERDPADRWQTAGELRDDLERLRVYLGTSASNRDVSAWVDWAFSLDAPPSATLGGRRPHGTSSFSSISDTMPSSSFSPISRSDALGAGASPGDVVALPGVPERGARGAQASRDDEEAAADLAWGSPDEEAAAAEPVLLDDIPDVSGKFAAAAVPASGPAALAVSGTVTTSAVGTGTSARPGAAPAPKARRGHVLLAGAAILAALAGVIAYTTLRPGDDAASAPPPVTTAVMKFAVEPADALITVQGYGEHQGAPLRLEVDAPGTYQVEIQREGYKNYVSQIELERNEIRSVQVVLEAGGSDKASLAVRSSPPAQQVALDGELLGQRTPVNLEVSPGPHVLAIVGDDGGELWRHEFEAAASTQYEFHPALRDPGDAVADAEEGERQRRRRRQRDERGRAEQAVADGARQPATSAAGPAATPAVSGASGDRPRPSSITAGTSVLDSLSMTAPPALPEPAKSDERKGPRMVSAKKMERVSGSLPRLSAGKGELPARVKALLCVDTRGAVSSVKIYDDMRTALRSELQHGLRRWRYEPYKENGKPVPVCFGVMFRTGAR